MNCFYFEEIELDQKVSFEYEINEEKMQKFREITGDLNPLHCDLNYAKEKGYNENVVYGMLSASILSTLAGMYLPGKKSLIHEVEIKFAKPVFLSKMPLTVNAKVVSKDERFKQITLKYTIEDNTKSKVVRGTMKVGVTD